MVEPLRNVDKFLAPSIPNYRLPPCPCDLCGKATRERKPWCINCLDASPYVKNLTSRIAAHYAAEEAVINGGPIDLNADPAKEIYWYLLISKECLHVDRLAQRCNLDKALVRRYCIAMAEAGKLRVTYGGRKNSMYVGVSNGN